MVLSQTEKEKWDSLLNLSEALLNSKDTLDANNVRTIRGVLDHALELFPKSLEPHEEWEAYVVRQFVKALRELVAAK